MRMAKLALCLLLVGLCSAHPQYPSEGDVVGLDTGCEPFTHDCVPYYQCINGVINTDGTGLIDPRIKPQTECTRPDYLGIPGLCCRIPGAVAPTPAPLQACPAELECVEQGQCNADGSINTDGSGLIDERINLSCYVTPGSPVIGVCCRPPPLDVCYGNQKCLVQDQCAADTAVQGSGGSTYEACFIDKANYVTGVCCLPPPLDVCYDNQKCLVQDQCAADTAVQGGGGSTYEACFIDKANYVTGVCCLPPPLDACYDNQLCLQQGQCAADTAAAVQGAVSATYDACFIDKTNYVTGVCCFPPTITCPSDSVCKLNTLCEGDILDKDNVFLPYSNSGPWSLCGLADGNTQSLGVCCRSPYRPADQCGVRNYGLNIRSQVKLNKNEALFGEFPWQAVLFFSNFTFKCGASLVADRWLVTGAHCVSGYQYGDFKVRLGEWRVDTYDEPLPYVDADIASITVHPDFNSENLHNDVAVIELTAPVPFQYHINTVCLPSPGQVPLAGTRCFASGWGKDAFEGSFQAILKKVDVPFVEHKYCQDLLRYTRLGKYFQLDQSFICAGGEENQDACTGDGGGPLVCEDPATGIYVLQGIVAWGIDCGKKDVPGVYADVQYFADWISDAIYGTPVAQVTAPHSPYGRK